MKFQIKSIPIIVIFTFLLAETWALYSLPTPHGATPKEKSARLLVSKQLLNKFVVENMDVIIKYSVFNIGTVAAYNVQLKDSTFGPDFEIVSGQAEVILGRIPPLANVTHTIVVRPVMSGYYNFTASQVLYTTGEDSNEVIYGWSSEPGKLIIPFREFDRRFSPHLLDWTAFAIMAVGPLFLPFILWRSSNAKYTAILRSKKSI